MGFERRNERDMVAVGGRLGKKANRGCQNQWGLRTAHQRKEEGIGGEDAGVLRRKEVCETWPGGRPQKCRRCTMTRLLGTGSGSPTRFQGGEGDDRARWQWQYEGRQMSATAFLHLHYPRRTPWLLQPSLCSLLIARH
jgi:hypothetical protein